MMGMKMKEIVMREMESETELIKMEIEMEMIVMEMTCHCNQTFQRSTDFSVQ
jgi:hypothetical protein